VRAALLAGEDGDPETANRSVRPRVY